MLGHVLDVLEGPGYGWDEWEWESTPQDLQ